MFTICFSKCSVTFEVQFQVTLSLTIRKSNAEILVRPYGRYFNLIRLHCLNIKDKNTIEGNILSMFITCLACWAQ